MVAFTLPESNHEKDGDQDSLPDTASVGSWIRKNGIPDPGPVATVKYTPFNWEDLMYTPVGYFSVRTLLIPHISCFFSRYPLGGSCGGWVKAYGKGASGKNKLTDIWAMGPGEEEPGFSIVSGQIRCIVLFDPADDRLIIVNQSQDEIYCKRPCTGTVVNIPVNETGVVIPGEWELSTDRNECQIQCKVLKRETLRVSQEPGTKRSAEDETSLSKRSHPQVGTDFNRITIPRGSFPNNPLLDIARGDAIHVGHIKDDYTLKLVEPIADRRLASSFKAEHSKIPGKLVLVKIIKPDSRRRESTVDAIQTWIREMSIHSNLGNHV